MQVVLSPDSFKGSLEASSVADIMEKAILDVDENIKIVKKPMADGGEGMIEVIKNSINFEVILIECKDALGDKKLVEYLITDEKKAIIELANISGLIQVPNELRDPENMTSYGLGEVILDALDKGCESILVGLGGSASNDSGLGMMIALGMKVYDENNNVIEGFGKDLHHIEVINVDDMDPRINQVKIEVACDVDNPLCGPNGASRVYGFQKGGTKEQLYKLDSSIKKYSNKLEIIMGKSVSHESGTGAAGGLGFGLRLLGANLNSGAKIIGETISIEDSICNADLVITGEGKSDVQTLQGKAPSYVARLAKKYEVPVILLSGSLDENIEELEKEFSGCFSILNEPMMLEKCMTLADKLLYNQTKQIIRFYKSTNNYFENNRRCK